MIEKIKNWLERSWWKKEEWVRMNREHTWRISDKNDCPSWDVESVTVIRYKNKNTCEERKRVNDRHIISKTLFKHPTETEEGSLEEHDIYSQ